MKEDEEMKASQKGTNEEDEAKDKGWENKIEELLSLMKENGWAVHRTEGEGKFGDSST